LALVGAFRSRVSLEAENTILRHQLNVLRRKSPKRPTFGMLDRLIFAGLYRLAPKVLGALAIVKPETVIKWHRAGFRSYWRWKSRRRGGRPIVAPEIRKLIGEMSIANPLWGAPRDPWRTPQARHRYRTDQRSQVHGQAKRPAIPRLEHVPSQSCRRHRRDGSVRGADNIISSALRLVDRGAWSWIACIADAQPLTAYVAYLSAANMAVGIVEEHNHVLAEFVHGIRTRLLAADVATGLQKLVLPGFDFEAAKKFARRAQEAVARGKLGYGIVTVIKP
jgi:hypothetical protein